MESLNDKVSCMSPVVIALGSNMAGRTRSPRETLEAAVRALRRAGIGIYGVSPWFRSAPVPPSPQAPFVNGVACAYTMLGPARLMTQLHSVERLFGRIRRRPNAPRTLDLDLIAYGPLVWGGGAQNKPVLPHPRSHLRPFVLQPLRLVRPGWRHPISGGTPRELLRRLPRAIARNPALVIDRPLRARGRGLKKGVRPKKP